MAFSQEQIPQGDGEGATTGSAENRMLTIKPHPNRLAPGQTRNPGKLTSLTPKHRLLIEYMVWGCPHATLSARVGHRPGTPLTVEEAGCVIGMRIRAARWVSFQPLFEAELARAMRAFRNGAQPEAFRTILDVMRDPGENKAADRKVRLQAAQSLLGEHIAQPNQTNINVGVKVGVQTTVTPGMVIDLTPQATDAKTIDLQANSTVKQSSDRNEDENDGD